MAELIVDGSVKTETLTLSSPNVPATPTSDGTSGDIAWDADYLYVCIAENTWARTAHSKDWGAL